MELLASPSLFFAFLAGTAFGDLLAGRFPLSFVSPRGELMSSDRLFVRPRIAWVSWLISSEEAAVLSWSCREACAGSALRSAGSESLFIWSSSPSSSISSARRSSSDCFDIANIFGLRL